MLHWAPLSVFDMEIIKFTVVGIICAVICLILKQVRPETAPFAEVASVMVIAVMLTQSLKNALSELEDLIGGIGVINDGYIFLLVKVLGVAVVTKTGADICRDCGNSALGVNVELAGKVIIFLMCLPLLKTVVELADGLLS